MNALAHHHVGQGNASRQHSHAHFTVLWLGRLFFNDPKLIGSAIVSDDDAGVCHGRGDRVTSSERERPRSLEGPFTHTRPFASAL